MVYTFKFRLIVGGTRFNNTRSREPIAVALTTIGPDLEWP